MGIISNAAQAASAWALEALLVFNLLSYLILRARDSQALAMVSMAVNVALISAAVGSSGGGQSLLWPLYLLPIYTACVYLERRHVLLAASSGGAFLAYFYLESIWSGTPWSTSELLLKLFIISVAAGVTMKIAFRERQERYALEEIRGKIERISALWRSKEEADRAAASKDDSPEAMIRAVQNLTKLHNIILCTAELLHRELQGNLKMGEDLVRIQEAARSCARQLREIAPPPPISTTDTVQNLTAEVVSQLSLKT